MGVDDADSIPPILTPPLDGEGRLDLYSSASTVSPARTFSPRLTFGLAESGR